MPRFQVNRSIHIKAAPEKVFDAVADFSTWTTWSPWLCAEPDAQVRVSEAPSSLGAIYAWKGEVVGEGEIEHRKLQPGRVIEDEIRFVKPFRSTSQVAFEMEATDDGTTLTWHMRGSLPWFLFWMRSQMEVFIGMDYDRGLKMLKDLIETGQILSQTTIHGVESVGPLRVAGIRNVCSVSEIGPTMEAAFCESLQKLNQANLPADGTVISVYHKFDLKAQTFDFTSGLVLPDSAGPIPEGLSSWSIPAMQALRVRHIGRYEHLGNAWSAAHQYARYKKLKPSKVGAYEVYKNDPENTPPAELCTEVLLPLK